VKQQSIVAQQRILRLAHDFLVETRVDLARAVAEGADLPPRIRAVTERPGHASPEYRTLAVPIPPGVEGGSPTALSGAIASYAARHPPSSLLLMLDVIGSRADGGPQPLLIAEARDRLGTRLFLVQPFDVVEGRIVWQEPLEGGWRDPGDEEMIIDAAFVRSTGT
jgi:hypothetical protein